MIGTWRWMLSLLVVVAHLYGPWWPGSFGVFTFYILSGFLMTLILSESYGFSLRGFRTFWINRILRIYPTYYLSCLLSVALILSLPEEFVRAINTKLHLPTTFSEILTNLTILGLPGQPIERYRAALVPPAWALSIELFYYIVISVWAGRNRRNAAIFLAAGLAYLLGVYVYADFAANYRYFYIGAGALPFAVGTNLYFHKDRLMRWIGVLPWGVALALAFTCYGLVFFIGTLVPTPQTLPFYLNIVSSSFLLLVLWHVPKGSYKPVDAYLGDLSYATYLIHWQVGIVVAYLFDLPFGQLPLFLISTVLVTVVSVLDVKLVSRPIERRRRKYKLRLTGTPDDRAPARS